MVQKSILVDFVQSGECQESIEHRVRLVYDTFEQIEDAIVVVIEFIVHVDVDHLQQFRLEWNMVHLRQRCSYFLAGYDDKIQLFLEYWTEQIGGT